MKLLDKKRLTSDANVQKKAQIDEGVRIARAVDINREELASLEKQRADFIAGSKNELLKQIAPLQEKKETLLIEIKKVEEELAEKRKPLDKEWALLAEDVLALHREQEQLEQNKNELSKKEEEFEKENLRLAKEEAKQKADKKAIETLADEIETHLTTAKKLSTEAKKNYEETTRRSNDEAKKIAWDREQNQVTYEANIRFKESLDVREEALNNKERFIKDRYATLLKITKK